MPVPPDAGVAGAGERSSPATWGVSLSDRIYPPAGSSTTKGRQGQELALRDTRFAQPAIGAVSLGLWRFSKISAFAPT